MKQIKINELKLRNFKGIKDFTLKADGNNANIYGENATGKTSIMDAFIWLLFNKDSHNSSQFNIKTLDGQGKVIHGLEHEVSAKLEIDSTEIELTKIYKEKWQKKRGQTESQLTGHTTEYFINSVPKKKSEYDNYLGNIIDEDTFRILTNPLYFNNNLKWQDRRSIALSICGEVQDREVVTQDNKLKDLEKLLENKSIDDLKAEMAARRRKLNEELKSIPYRIDELSREDLDVDVEALAKEKKELEGELAELRSAKGIDYDFQIRNVNGTITQLKNELKEIEYSAVKDLREKLNELLEEKSATYRDLTVAHDELAAHTSKIKKLKNSNKEITAELERLRNQFNEWANKQFDEESTVCPTCEQDLPSGIAQSYREDFERGKSKKLKDINTAGKNYKEILADNNEMLEGLEALANPKEKAIINMEFKLKDTERHISMLEEEIKNIDISGLEGYKEIQEKIFKLNKEKEEVLDLQAKKDKSEEISNLQIEINSISKELAKLDLAKDNEKRVDELKDRERELAQMVADTEKTEFLADQFVITKADLLEDKLNNKFDLVKFKLFDVQVNGGINETFVTTVDGVPFEDLNSAMRINAGLDIIKTLSNYYEIQAPIFIDNAESVNELLEIPNQMIRLIVSKHKYLNVQVEGNKCKT